MVSFIFFGPVTGPDLEHPGPMHVGGSVALILALSLLGAAPARASTPFPIKKAATIYVTPRGMSVFQSELTPILERNGVDLSHGSLPKWEYTSPTAISLSQLPARFAEYAPALKFLKNELKSWLMGFSLRDPRLAVQAKDVGYSLQGITYALVPDHERTQYLAATGAGGIAVRLEVTIPQLRAEASEVMGQDLNNAFLGGFGVRKPWIETAEPIQISVPIQIAVKPGGNLSLKTMDVATNIASVRLMSGYQSPLVLPKVQVQINDRTMSLDPRPAETALVSRKAELVGVFQHHLADFVMDELPLRLDGMAYDQLVDGFKFVSEIGPPGVDTFGTGDKFKWTLRLSDLSLTRSMLKLELEGSLADPAVTWDEKLVPSTPAKPPALAGLPAADFDVAFAVSFDVLNRIVALGYQRGGLDQITESSEGGDTGDKLKLVSAPRFAAAHGGHAKLHLQLERATAGVRETIGLKSPYVVDLDLNLKSRVNRNGTFDFVIEDIDLGTASIDAKYVRLDRFRKSVAEGLRDRLVEINRGFLKKERTVADLVAAPTDLFGMRVSLQHVEFDPSGYLNLYNRFDGLAPEHRSCAAYDGKSCRGDSR